MKKIRTQDSVIVITGKNKGKTGKVTQVLADGRVVIAGVNIVKRHTRANPQLGKPGGILDKEMPLDISNVAIVNPKTGKADRVGFDFVGEGQDKKKVRIYKSDKSRIEETKP